MKIYGTYPSHFTRKIRILCAELDVKYEFIVLENLLAVGEANFARNPLHMFPVLEDKGKWLIESDVIAEYLIRTYGPQSILWQPLAEKNPQKAENQVRLAIINGAMEAGVHIIRAKRSGISEWEKYPFFQQEKAAIQDSLAWLDRDLAGKEYFAEGSFTYLDGTFLCLGQWLVFREFLPSLSAYKNLENFVRKHEKRPSIASTHPALGA